MVATTATASVILEALVIGLGASIVGLFSGLAMATAILIGGRAVMRGDITIGDFVAFIFYLAMLTWPMVALGWVINLFQRGAASMRRINAILQSEPAIRDPVIPGGARSIPETSQQT